MEMSAMIPLLILACTTVVNPQGFRQEQKMDQCGLKVLATHVFFNINTTCTCYITSSHKHVYINVAERSGGCIGSFLLDPASTLSVPASMLDDMCTHKYDVSRVQSHLVLIVKNNQTGHMTWTEDNECSQASEVFQPTIEITADNIVHMNCRHQLPEELILEKCPHDVIPPLKTTPSTSGVNPLSTTSPANMAVLESSGNSAIIVGALIGTLVVIIVIIIVTALLCRRYLRKQPPALITSRESPSTNITCSDTRVALMSSEPEPTLVTTEPEPDCPVMPTNHKSEVIYDIPVTDEQVEPIYNPPLARNYYEPTYEEIYDNVAEAELSNDESDPYAHVGFSAAEIANAVMAKNLDRTDGGTTTSNGDCAKNGTQAVDVNSLYAKPLKKRNKDGEQVEMLDNELYNTES